MKYACCNPKCAALYPAATPTSACGTCSYPLRALSDPLPQCNVWRCKSCAAEVPLSLKSEPTAPPLYARFCCKSSDVHLVKVTPPTTHPTTLSPPLLPRSDSLSFGPLRLRVNTIFGAASCAVLAIPCCLLLLAILAADTAPAGQPQQHITATCSRNSVKWRLGGYSPQSARKHFVSRADAMVRSSCLQFNLLRDCVRCFVDQPSWYADLRCVTMAKQTFRYAAIVRGVFDVREALREGDPGGDVPRYQSEAARFQLEFERWVRAESVLQESALLLCGS